MPKDYLYADIIITNPAGYEDYRARAPATVAAFGGIYRVKGGNPDVVEGETNKDIPSVIVDFESRERLLEWYNSPEYEPLNARRAEPKRTNLVIMTGNDEQ